MENVSSMIPAGMRLLNTYLNSVDIISPIPDDGNLAYLYSEHIRLIPQGQAVKYPAVRHNDLDIAVILLCTSPRKNVIAWSIDLFLVDSHTCVAVVSTSPPPSREEHNPPQTRPIPPKYHCTLTRKNPLGGRTLLKNTITTGHRGTNSNWIHEPYSTSSCHTTICEVRKQNP